MLPPELSKFRASVVSACVDTIKAVYSNPMDPRHHCVVWGAYFIKFGDGILYDEAATQHYRSQFKTRVHHAFLRSMTASPIA